MREIFGLANFSRGELVERWLGLYGKEPPKRLTQNLLARGIAYEVQARHIGGLGSVEKKALADLAQGRNSPDRKKLKAGVRLYRSWQGITQEVLVLEGGYSWKGQSYGSLSEVARAITGTRWSGPRFFGVKA